MSTPLKVTGIKQARVRFSSSFICPPSRKWVPGEKLWAKFSDEMNWPPCLPKFFLQMAPLVVHNEVFYQGVRDSTNLRLIHIISVK